jgi:hypothetical protein
LQGVRALIKQALENPSFEARSASYPTYGSTRPEMNVRRKRFGAFAWIALLAICAALAVLFMSSEELFERDAEATHAADTGADVAPLAEGALPAESEDSAKDVGAEQVEPTLVVPSAAAPVPSTPPSAASTVLANSIATPKTALRKKKDASGASASEEPESDEPGFLTLDTTPWSEVRLGSRKLGVTPLVSVALPNGKHTLVLRNPELGIVTQYTVQIEAGKTVVRKLGID